MVPSSQKLVITAGCIGALAIALLVMNRTQHEEEIRRAKGPTISDPKALRIHDIGGDWLTVYRVVVDGEGTNLCSPEPLDTQTVRVDFKVDGKHVTLWLKDAKPRSEPEPPMIEAMRED